MMSPEEPTSPETREATLWRASHTPLTAAQLAALVTINDPLKRAGAPLVEAPPKRPAPANSLEAALASDRPDFDALAVYLSDRAELAYKSEPEVANAVSADGGCDFKYFHHLSAAGFGFTRNGHAWLVFRGSRPWELVFPDFAFVPWTWPPQHVGFVIYWRLLEAQVREWLHSLPPEVWHAGIILSGHSLGGALAILAGYDLAAECPIRAVVTFGAPRAGMLPFRYAYRASRGGLQSLDDVTVRYTHRTDLISRVPPPLLYWHVGNEREVFDDGTVEYDHAPGLAERALRWWDSWTSPAVKSNAPSPGGASAPAGPQRPTTPLEPYAHILPFPTVTPGESTPTTVAGRTFRAWARLVSATQPFLFVLALPVWLLFVGAGIAMALIGRLVVGDIDDHFCRHYVAALRVGHPELCRAIDEARARTPTST